MPFGCRRGGCLTQICQILRSPAREACETVSARCLSVGSSAANYRCDLSRRLGSEMQISADGLVAPVLGWHRVASSACYH